MGKGVSDVGPQSIDGGCDPLPAWIRYGNCRAQNLPTRLQKHLVY
jgi:hypothetical protein